MRLAWLLGCALGCLAQPVTWRARLVTDGPAIGPVPVPRATVWAVTTDCRESHSAPAGPDGVAAFALPAGNYRIYASGERLEAREVDVKVGGGAPDTVDLVYRAASEDTAGKPLHRPWRFRVVDATGTAIVGAQLQLLGRGRRTPSGFLETHAADAGGEVNLCRMRGELVEVTVECGGCQRTKRTFPFESSWEQHVIRVRRGRVK